LTAALLGERWTADGQRCLHSDQRVFSRVGIDGDRRQEPVSPLFEMLRDDNVRRLCNSFVGANGRSPEKGPGWNLCLLREKWDIRDLSVPLFNYSQSTLNAFARCYAQAITRNAPLNRGIGGFEGFLARTKVVLISELVLGSELNVQVAKK